MVVPLQLSIDSSLTADALASVQKHGMRSSTSDNVAIRDTVTLSAAALLASRLPNLLAFPRGNGASVLVEFPVEALLEKGYSISQVAIDLGLSPQMLDADLEIQVRYSAA